MAASASPWQYGPRTLIERIRKMRKGGHFHDHVIKVIGKDQEKEFKVHKLLLSIASPYFEKLFYGSLPSDSEVTDLEDVEPNLFEEFLSYVYTDKLPNKSLEIAKGVYVLADRFLVPELKNHCRHLIDKQTGLNNIFDALEFHRFYSHKMLTERCEKEIEKNFSILLDTQEFLKCEKETLLWILQNDYLNVDSEIKIYNCAVNWLNEKKKTTTDEEEFQKICSEVMHQIRFSCMSAADFTCGPAVHSYLPIEDKLAFLAKLNCDAAPMEFPKDYCLRKRKSYIDIDGGENETEGSDNEADKHKLPNDWRSRMYTAVESGDIKIMDSLYLKGADLGAKYGRNRRTLLQVASSAGKSESVSWLLKRRVKVSDKNLWGWTALHIACRAGHEAIVMLLIENGADREAHTNNGKTPYDVANEQIKDMFDVQGLLVH